MLEVRFKDTKKVVDFFQNVVEIVISVLDWCNFRVNSLNSLSVCTSGRILTITIQPLTIFFKKLENWWNISRFSKLTVRICQILSPFVDDSFKFIFTFISFKDKSVLV